MNLSPTQQFQQILFNQGYYTGKIDGIFGPQSQQAFKYSISLQYCTSFADPKDVAAFKACKAEGKSDEECFKVGDNGIGFWGDDTSEGSGCSVALPPEVLIAKWGNLNAAHMKPVNVYANGKSVVALVKDTMPHLTNIINGACVDCNPDTVKALGMTPPMSIKGWWEWA